MAQEDLVSEICVSLSAVQRWEMNLKYSREIGYKVILVSNQSSIAKGPMSEENFEGIKKRMKEDLSKEGAFLDGEYYCLHHPEAKVEELKGNCDCRKPKLGLLLQAAGDLGIDLSESWMIGDGLTDTKAVKDAGAKTILLGKMKCELCHLMTEEDAKPDVIASNLKEATEFILDKEAKCGNLH